MNDLTGQQWETPIYGILSHPDRNAVLFWESDSGVTLPFFTLFDEGLWLGPDVVQTWLSKKIGVPVNVLRRAAYRTNPVARRGEAVYVVEARAGIEGALGRWEDEASVAGLALANEAHRSIVETHFAEVRGSAPAERAPWAHPGWHAVAERWIGEQLENLGHTVEAIEPLRNWGLSCVFRARTGDGGRFIFKAGIDTPLFANEGVVLQTLSHFYAGLVPTPLAVDAGRRWMLIPESPGTAEYDAPPDEVILMLRALAQMQRDAAERVDALLAAGCLDRRPAWLATQVAVLLADEEGLEGLSREEIDRLRRFAPELERRCRALDRDPLPPTLVHGDFHPGNVAIDGEQICIFDWTDAAISHPFFDLLHVYGAGDPEKEAQLRAAYLAPWAESIPHEKLEAAYAFAEPLCAFNQAVSYRGLIRRLEPAARHELAWGVPHWLRLVLKTIA